MTLWEIKNLIQYGTKIHIYEEIALGPYIFPMPQLSIIVSRKETVTKYDDWTVRYIATTDNGELRIVVKNT